MRKKGISPLIAAVLLIAFTMAIAGLMATWATTFSREQLDVAQSESKCLGAIDLSSLTFGGGVVTVRIRNVGDRLNLTGLSANLEYDDTAKNRNYILSQDNIPNPLTPGVTAWWTRNTTEPSKPIRIEVIATNCPKNSAILNFK